jgi:hypothetical protein
VGRIAPLDGKRKRRRRPPQEVLERWSAEDLKEESEFRRWRHYAPESLRRPTYEIIRKLVRRAGRKEG